MRRFKLRVDDRGFVTVYTHEGFARGKFEKRGVLRMTPDEAEGFARALRTGCKWNGDLDFEVEPCEKSG